MIQRMTHSEIEELNIVDRYALNQLSEVQQEQFELHLLDCEICQEALEATLSLISGVHAEQLNQSSAKEIEDQPVSQPTSAPKWFDGVQAIAAALIVACGIVLLPLMGDQDSPILDAPFGNTVDFSLDTMRSSKPVIPAGKELTNFNGEGFDSVSILLSLALLNETAENTRFNIELTDSQNSSFSTTLTADEWGDATLVLSVDQLAAGPITIVSTPEKASEQQPTKAFFFNFVK